MGYAFMIVVGAVLGWLAAFVMRTESRRALQLNVVAGITGALLAGLVLGPEVSTGNLAAGRYTVGILLVSMAGALVAIGVANILRRREVL